MLVTKLCICYFWLFYLQILNIWRLKPATHTRVLSDAVMPHPSGASMSQFLVLSAHRSTVDSGGGGGVASAHSQAQQGHLLSPYPVLWDGGENRKNEKAHG